MKSSVNFITVELIELIAQFGDGGLAIELAGGTGRAPT